ncbi:MAG: GntR family transcriptional regulator [Actinobacteria bacterium]|nr:GntR family transcriptional regulator [Actinomycetota bacterium]
MATPPRYIEIAEYVRGLTAEASPGDRLPSDAELCERFGVSRMTARQAITLLANEGLLERRRGSGTFASARRVPRTLGSPLSFSESTRGRGMKPTSRVLRAGPTDLTPEDAEALGIEITAPAIVLERLRLADGIPMAIEHAVMPADDSGLLDEDLTSGSLHEAFERRGRTPTHANAEVGARRATKRERTLLQLPPSGIVLTEIRTIFDQYGAPLEHTSTFYAADRYTFMAVLYRGPGDTPS